MSAPRKIISDSFLEVEFRFRLYTCVENTVYRLGACSTCKYMYKCKNIMQKYREIECIRDSFLEVEV